ncbi:MAG: hypothetical protein H8E16_15180 [Flavobacteriales bacterium]|nr:hypothetical protein [Flavobacteriales bacterium]
MALIGSFTDDLELYLAESKGRNRASKQSQIDIPRISAKSDGVLNPGQMYCFNYYTKDEIFYDTKPLVIGLGESDNGHQLGINLHYMPYEARIPFLTELTVSLKTQIAALTKGKALGNPDAQSPITAFRWEFVKRAFGKKYNLTYCTRQYIIKKMKNPYVLGYEDWYVGAVNNENQFYGGNINQAQALYYKNI